MKKQTYAIIAGAVVILLVCVTLLATASLWFGINVIRGQASAATASGPLAWLSGSAWSQDGRPYARGLGGPGMMWGYQPGGRQPNNRGFGGPGMMWRDPNWDWDTMPCTEGSGGPGAPGGGWGAMPCGQSYPAPDSGGALSLEEAEAAVEAYVDQLGYTGLHPTEVMEFEQNFYAIVAEEDTGIGAMELLVDRSSGAVGPEPGPNMMWNAKYGMHRGGRMGMMGSLAADEMTISGVEAEELAQQWLDANLPGRTAGEADEFYGYYTLHFLKDGDIEGMLSVHGSSGDVWYHSWHGDFVTMIEGHD
jgi:hypothetical protein